MSSGASWAPLGEVEPPGLTEARLQAHWAAQVVMSPGNTWLEPEPDDSHTSMSWSPQYSAVVGKPLPTGHRSGLMVADLSLVIFDETRKVCTGLALDGKRLEGAQAWMAELMYDQGAGDSRPLHYRDYDMPHHRVQDGEPFHMKDAAAFGELARWFGNAEIVLSAVASAHEHTTPVRCWPHHFDIATLILLDPDKGAEASRSINVGMSPGDANYAEPYFYVNPWPASEPPSELTALPEGGHWHREGWFGAVLPGSALVAGSRDDQADRLKRFIDAAIEADRAILDARG